MTIFFLSTRLRLIYAHPIPREPINCSEWYQSTKMSLDKEIKLEWLLEMSEWRVKGREERKYANWPSLKGKTFNEVAEKVLDKFSSRSNEFSRLSNFSNHNFMRRNFATKSLKHSRQIFWTFSCEIFTRLLANERFRSFCALEHIISFMQLKSFVKRPFNADI